MNHFFSATHSQQPTQIQNKIIQRGFRREQQHVSEIVWNRFSCGSCHESGIPPAFLKRNQHFLSKRVVMLGFPGRIWRCHFSANNCGAVWSSLIWARFTKMSQRSGTAGSDREPVSTIPSSSASLFISPKGWLALDVASDISQNSLSSCFALCVLDGFSLFPQFSVCYCVESAAGESLRWRIPTPPGRILLPFRSEVTRLNCWSGLISWHTKRRWRDSVQKNNVKTLFTVYYLQQISWTAISGFAFVSPTLQK